MSNARKSGQLDRMREWRRARKARIAERAAVRREQKLPSSAHEHGGNKPGAGGGYSGGH
jgi:hypothetical protein